MYNVHSNSLLQKLFNSVEIERLLGSLDDFLKFGSQLQKGPLILLPWYVMPQKDVKGYQHHNVFTNITKTLRNKRNDFKYKFKLNSKGSFKSKAKRQVKWMTYWNSMGVKKLFFIYKAFFGHFNHIH